MIAESEKRLREYVENDKIYQDYKNNGKEPSDFERFCFVHCRDIENVLKENQQLKEQLKDENNYHNEAVKWYKEAFEIEQERIKYRNVLDEIREYIKEYIREDADYSNYMEMRKEKYNELLQILDKVKENESRTNRWSNLPINIASDKTGNTRQNKR